MTSTTSVAVTCDADEPCSVHTAQEPESYFIMSPIQTFRFHLRILEMTDVNQRSKMKCSLFSLCLFDDLSFALLFGHLVICHAGNLSSFSTLCPQRLLHPGFSLLGAEE